MIFTTVEIDFTTVEIAFTTMEIDLNTTEGIDFCHLGKSFNQSNGDTKGIGYI